MELQGTENVASMKNAVDGLMHQTQAVFVTDWLAADVADAVNRVGYTLRSDPGVEVWATVRRTGHNRNVVSIRIKAPYAAKANQVQRAAEKAAEQAVRTGLDEMRRSGFAKVKANL